MSGSIDREESRRYFGMASAVEIIFYYREDCHLCDKMQVDLDGFRRQTQDRYPTMVTMRDIEDDERWFQWYHEYVPVLVVNDEEVCHYFFDSRDMMSAINQHGGDHATTPG